MDKEQLEFLSDYMGVTQFEYNALRHNDGIFTLLITAIKRSAKLDYSGEKFELPSGVIDSIVKVLLPDTYDEIMTKLQADKELEGDFGA